MNDMPQIDTAERQFIISDRINRGQDSYAGRLDAWHRLGVVTGKYNTWRELLVAAKADFYVFKSQLHDGRGKPVDAYGTFRWDIADKQANNIENAKFLGVVGKDYTVIQHTAGFDILDRLVGEIDGAHYETMGTLDYGRLVWGQVDPNINIAVGEDVTKVYLTFHTSHDGSKAFDIFETGVREVCRNTFRLGSLNRLGATLRVRHTKNAPRTIQSLQAEIAELNKTAQTMQYKLNVLAGRKVTRQTVEELFAKLFPVKAKEDGGTGESSTRRDNQLADILALYESNDGNAFPEQRGTAYNLFNAVTEWTDHYRKTTDPAAAVLGTGDNLKLKTLDELLRVAPTLEPANFKAVPVVVRP